MKVRAKELEDQQRIETLDTLYTAAGTVHGRDAMKLFLRDLLTESERIMLGRRIIIARRLLEGEPYSQIASELKMGHDTIYRVQRWLWDKLPGYEQAVKGYTDEIKKREIKRKDKKLYAESPLYRLKKKYPGHFLLFSISKPKK